MKFIQAFLAVVTVAGLSVAGTGCLTEQAPVTISKGTYTEIKKEEHRTLPKETRVLTLDEAQDVALQNNPSFKSAYFAIDAARAAYYKCFSYYMPTVTVDYTIGQAMAYGHNEDYNNGLDTVRSHSTPSLSANLTVFDSLQREMNLLAAKHNWKETAAAEQDARRLLIKSVATAYNNVLLAQAQCRIALANMKYNYDLLKETELKLEAGASPLSDVLNFKVKYNTAENTLYEAEYATISYKFALAQLLGLTEGVIPEDVQFPMMPSPDGEMLASVDFYLDQALQNRPDLKQYREAYEAAKYTYYSSIGAFGPTVSVYAELADSWARTKSDYSHCSSSEGDTDTRPHGWEFNYGLSVSWEIFSGGRTYFTMRSAQANMKSAEFTVENAWATVINDVRTAYENYQTNLKKVKLYQKNLELVRKQRDLVNQEYIAGSTGITRLNEAQTELVNAESSLADAVINMHNAKAQLQAATNAL